MDNQQRLAIIGHRLDPPPCPVLQGDIGRLGQLVLHIRRKEFRLIIVAHLKPRHIKADRLELLERHARHIERRR